MTQPSSATPNATRSTACARWTAALMRQFPPGQFGRYLIVGGCNTVFGYGTYAGLTALLTPHVPYAYMVAIAIASFVNITFSFLNYKWFIFKTKGNYLREWSRCVFVSGSSIVVGTAVLPFTVFAVRYFTPAVASAPYIAGALQMGANVIVSFLGHKKFSFASSKLD